jgi:hypothetical protein
MGHASGVPVQSLHPVCRLEVAVTETTCFRMTRLPDAPSLPNPLSRFSSHIVATNTNAPAGAVLVSGEESGIGSGRASPLTSSTARSEPLPERSRASPNAASFPSPLAREFSSHSVATNTDAPLGALLVCGGESGIRTHEELAPLPVFKTGAFNRSAISPISYLAPVSQTGTGFGFDITSLLRREMSLRQRPMRTSAKTGAFNRSAISPISNLAPVFQTVPVLASTLPHFFAVR